MWRLCVTSRSITFDILICHLRIYSVQYTVYNIQCTIYRTPILPVAVCAWNLGFSRKWKTRQAMYVWRNIEAHSCNYCCSEEAIYNIYRIFSNIIRTFYSSTGLKNQMRIRIACGLDSRSWAGFWKNDRAAVRDVRTIQYNNLLFYLFILYYII